MYSGCMHNKRVARLGLVAVISVVVIELLQRVVPSTFFDALVAFIVICFLGYAIWLIRQSGR
jgi:hypothetical protein